MFKFKFDKLKVNNFFIADIYQFYTKYIKIYQKFKLFPSDLDILILKPASRSNNNNYVIN